MFSVVVYDISDNKARTDLIKHLQHYGLYRLQKSVFIGYLELESMLDLAEEFEKFLSSDKDSIVLFPLCKSCRESISLEGNAPIPVEDRKYEFL